MPDLNEPTWRQNPWGWPLWATLALLPLGFVIERTWQSFPRAHFAELLAIAVVAGLVAILARRLARVALADGLLLAFVIGLTAFAGPLPVLAMALLAMAAAGLALMLIGPSASSADDGSTPSPHIQDTIGIAALAGIAMITGTLGWLLPFPIHFRWIHIAPLLAIVWLARVRLRDAGEGLRRSWRAAVDADPRFAAFGVMAAGLASVGCWLPTLQFDDLSYHLGLPMQLAALGYYRLDAQSQIWALAPWSGDVLQGLAQVLAGREARGAVDAFWLVALLGLTWQLAAALDLPPRARWLALAVVASQPLLASLAGGMQAELPATTAAFALAVIVARAGPAADRRLGLAFALIAGMLFGLKTGFAALVLPFALCLAWRWRRDLGARGFALGLAAFLSVCGASYAYAYALTGNPVFPILNGVFRSPLLDAANLSDPRWHAPVGWDLPWRLAFRTGEYAEGWNGAAGFSLLALAGALPAALRLPRLRWLAAAAFVALCAAIGTVHYFRYAFPALTLLGVALAAAAARVLPSRAFAASLSALVVLDFAYQGAAFWTLHGNALTREVGALSVAPAFAHFAPERGLAAWVRAHDPDAHVLFCAWDRPAAAELAGRGFTISNYDPELTRGYAAAQADASGAGWRALFRRTGAAYAATHDPETSPALAAALSDASVVLEINGSRLWRLPPAIEPAPDLSAQRDAARGLWRW